MEWWHIVLIYLLLVNLAGFITMGLDKWKARKNKWRVPEKMLFLLALLGGSVGTTLGMYTFRHKTKHWYFRVGMPLIVVLQIAAAIWISLK